MPVLILAIASFLFFIGTLVLLCIADRLESRTRRRNLMRGFAQPVPVLSMDEAFDRAHGILWDAPIAALKLASVAGPKGVPVATLRPIYKSAAKQFPEIYDGCDFLHWIQFLQNNHLIAWHDFSIVLTEHGQSFLKFCFVTDAAKGRLRSMA